MASVPIEFAVDDAGAAAAAALQRRRRRHLRYGRRAVRRRQGGGRSDAARAAQPAPLLFASVARRLHRAGQCRRRLGTAGRTPMTRASWSRFACAHENPDPRSDRRRFRHHAQHRAQDPVGQPLRAGCPRGSGRASPRSSNCAPADSTWSFSTTTCRVSTALRRCRRSSAERPNVAVVMMTSTAGQRRRRPRAGGRRAGLPQEAVLSGRHRRRARAPFRPAHAARLARRDFIREDSSAANAGAYWRGWSSENSPLRMRVPRPSANVAAASSP